jgi:outer membrane protein OmpA-like peptidoglycan-associated protein
MKKFVLMFLCGTMILSGCGMSNTGKGSLIGSGAGAAIGAGLGYLIGKDGKGAAIGAAIGTAVGGGTGAIIGNKMDKKAEELAALENAQVETVEDVNGLKAIKVTFDSGILFDFNKATLKADAKRNLDKFAVEMADLPDTDITVLGHTDNVGTAEANQKVSDNRANAVSNYLQGKGIAKERIIAEGHSFNDPVADNSTAEGRAQNRRVEIYISANENMIKKAESGELQ